MVAVFAGTGLLPSLLLQVEPAVIVQFEGMPSDVTAPPALPRVKARFEQLGALFDRLRDEGVREVCLAGAMARPALDPVAFDPFTAKHMPALMAAMGKGDDALLRAIIAVIERAGFEVIAAHEIRPDLVAEAGLLAGTPLENGDAARGRAVLEALGPLDVGQSAVVAQGQIIGLETLQGTDAMLRFVADTRPGSGGVLVKRPKVGQDLRADMPAIGVETVRLVAAAGLKGIEIAAGVVLLLDRAAILSACEDERISLWAGP